MSAAGADRHDAALPADREAVPRHPRIAWVGSYTLAVEIARRSQRPIFIDFFDPG